MFLIPNTVCSRPGLDHDSKELFAFRTPRPFQSFPETAPLEGTLTSTKPAIIVINRLFEVERAQHLSRCEHVVGDCQRLE